MPVHLQRAISQLMKLLVALSAKVEESVKRVIHALEENNIQMARDVIEDDKEIDVREIAIEEECLKILALHQPVARDLRFLVAVLKINNDLERIGDLAQNISYHVIHILSRPVLIKPARLDILGIYQKVQSMLKKSLDSIVNLEVTSAYDVLKSDDEVDHLQREFETALIEVTRQDPGDADVFVQYIHIARHLERIADHATNVAEDIIYLINGDIVRHGSGKE
jgi:phosphate transport system protein